MKVGNWECNLDRTALYSCANCVLDNTRDIIHIRVFMNGTP